ncbi:lacr bacterial regulatory protein hth signature [Lucifera butyrica]|uniref:Lactose phosphotransferase system repressor n=2 Tax=Lucifera butyrica TaxID=1351585 RepID=A0A498QXT9_9FIRM|nr:lacr bacterial regulatory protein hth signature [Lucifera butyrica]
MTARMTKILNIINENKKIEVSKLSDLLGVSQVTIRKDLDILVDKGLICREHGYAVLNDSDDINNRLAINYDIKQKIAKQAANLVSNGETVMIESGSSCAIFAEELAKNKRDITIITNSAFIASYIRQYANCKMILLGGEYQKESQVNVGPITRKCAGEFYVDKLFVGVDGFSAESGFMSSDLMRAEAVKSMAESAKKVILLTDATKFNRRSLVVLFPLSKVDYLFTNNSIPVDAKALIESNNIVLNIV